MNTITLFDLVKFYQYGDDMAVFANFKGTEEWFNISYLITTCEEQDIPFEEVIVSF